MRSWMVGLVAIAAGLVVPATGAAQVPDLDVRPGAKSIDAGRTDGLLTTPSTADPERIALDYVREHFPLADADVDNLELVSRAVSPDGITHLRFNQTLDGIESYDSGIDAHVTRDGRLITVNGAPVRGASLKDKTPAVSALSGLGEARRTTRGLALPPRVTKSTPAAATFATGEAAKLRWIAVGGKPRLAWDIYAEGGESSYTVLVDAESGDTLVRKDLTEHVGGARYFPRDPDTSPITQITMPPSWYDQNNGGTRLWGQYSRTYIDPNDQDPAPGSEEGGTRRQIPESSPGSRDWLYTRTTFPAATPCPVGGCAWDSTIASSRDTNQFQAATNVHVLVGRFSEYLAQPPIGFDEASGNFQRVNASGAGLGNDYIRSEVNDGQGFNNANFATPSDGNAPRMQMYLFTGRNANGSDVADVVYHEIGHGLSNRLIVNASGSGALNAIQGSMMGEAWSDFYALDLLQSQGWVTDTAAADVTTGNHVSGPNGIRSKPIDCPVAPAGLANCDRNGTATTVLGGYTYGDLARTNNVGGPHNGGEVWAETLWDLRRAVGRDAALALITGGMRLTVDNPSMIDARDAIIQQALAMRSAPDAPNDYFPEVWEVFRARGMGFDATTTGPADTAPVENFDEPWNALYMQESVLRDAYPGGDNDGHFEPGERVQVSAPVYSAGLTDLSGVTGTLSSPTATIEDGSATWALLGKGRTAANADPLVGRMPAACVADVPFTVTVTSPETTADRTTRVSMIPTSRTVVPIADRVGGGPAAVTNATFVVSGGGTITDVNAHIGELRHPYLGDLTIELIHAGETVMLFNPPDALDGDDIVDAVFDSDSATPVYSAGPGPATGTMRPQDTAGLDRFDGLPAAGVWTLRITDLADGDAGVLRDWGAYGGGFPCGRLEIPTASTGGADGPTTDSATVNGSVTPNGRATGLRFAYGTTTAYGATTATQDVGAGDAPVPGTAALTGLAPGTTYHYRVESIREGGAVAVAGEDRTFTTAPAPVPQPAVSATPSPGGGGGDGADRTAPTFAGRPKVKLAKAGRKNRRATFSFSLSEAARVNAVVTRAEKGIRKGKRCVAVPKRKPKGAKNCTRQVNAARGSTTLTKAGVGTLALPKKGLGKGRYTAVLTAVDVAGNQSRATVTFTIR